MEKPEDMTELSIKNRVNVS